MCCLPAGPGSIWRVSESFPEFAKVITELARPGRIDIVGAKSTCSAGLVMVSRTARPPLPIHQAGALAALGEIFTVVIDTSMITSDVIKTVKWGLPSPLYLAMRTGLVRGFMAHHTWAEVPRILAKRAPREGADLAAAEKLWWQSYVKVIRFVPTGDLPPGDPVLEQALGARDPRACPRSGSQA